MEVIGEVWPEAELGEKDRWLILAVALFCLTSPNPVSGACFLVVSLFLDYQNLLLGKNLTLIIYSLVRNYLEYLRVLLHVCIKQDLFPTLPLLPLTSHTQAKPTEETSICVWGQASLWEFFKNKHMRKELDLLLWWTTLFFLRRKCLLKRT